jgi:tight adherence protein C
MRIGQSRETALREFAGRCGVKDLETFVSAVIQSQRLGVSLGKILRVQSDSLRVTRRQRVQETAQKAPIKLVFPLILCIFPALFVVIVGPAAIRIYDAVLSGVLGG